MSDWEARIDAAVGWAERGRIAEAWLEEVGFPMGDDIARVDALDAHQLTVARALSEHADVYIDRFAIPSSNRIRRRWIGLDPATCLERIVAVDLEGEVVQGPMWWVWRTCEEADACECVEATLSPMDRLVAAAELELADDEGYRLCEGPDPIDALAAVGANGSWGFADEALSLFASGEPHPENGMRARPSDLLQLLATVPLALAEVPFVDRWAPLIPVTRNRAFMQAIAAWLPAERRDQLLLERFDDALRLEAIDGALHTLEVFDLPACRGWLGALLKMPNPGLPRDMLRARRKAFAALP